MKDCKPDKTCCSECKQEPCKHNCATRCGGGDGRGGDDMQLVESGGSYHKNYYNDQKTDEPVKRGGCCGGICGHEEIPQIMVALLMQDGPFLMLRLSLCIEYKVINELHIFFLCKNAIICILLLHRVIILVKEDQGGAAK